MKIKLKVWRQQRPDSENGTGDFKEYELDDISEDTSFLEMLDTLNDQLEKKGESPIAFDSDCREGICGMCGITINGRPHGPGEGTTTCQLYMRQFNDGETLTLEPWRATAFPVLKDLVVKRKTFDDIISAGGYVSVNTGAAPDANALPISKPDAELAMDAAQCIGCGACVAACKNASAMLFVSAKVSHLNLLPQGQPEKNQRVVNMVKAMDEAGFGNCTNEYECEAHCPKEISVSNIARMNRQYLWAKIFG